MRFQNSTLRPSCDIGLNIVLEQHTFSTQFQRSSKFVCRLLNTNKSPLLTLCLGQVIFCNSFTNCYFSTYFNIHNAGWSKIRQAKFKKKIKKYLNILYIKDFPGVCTTECHMLSTLSSFNIVGRPDRLDHTHYLCHENGLLKRITFDLSGTWYFGEAFLRYSWYFRYEWDWR